MTPARPLQANEDRPTLRGWLAWTEQSAGRQASGVLAALLCAWTFFPFALWLAALGMIGGILAGIFGAESIGLAHTFHVSEGVGFAGALVGAIVGAAGGFAAIYAVLLQHPASLLGDVLSGLVAAFVALAIILRLEDRLQELRGYRPLSKRERELVDPILSEVLDRMHINGSRPNLYMSDSRKPEAWTNAYSIVIAQGLLGDYGEGEGPPRPELPRNALAAVLAHEAAHWESGDSVAIRAVWCCFWPVVAFSNLAYLLTQQRGWLGWFGWLILWPAWVSVRLVTLLMRKTMRQHEYDADARAAALGDDYRLGLRRALSDLRDWEAPRTGWEDALMATHPQIEQRLERLEARAASEQPASHPDRPLPEITVTIGAGPDELLLDHPSIKAAGLPLWEADEAQDLAAKKAAEPALFSAILDRLRAEQRLVERGAQPRLATSQDYLATLLAAYESRAADPGVTMPDELRPTINFENRELAAARRQRARTALRGRLAAASAAPTPHPTDAGEQQQVDKTADLPATAADEPEAEPEVKPPHQEPQTEKDKPDEGTEQEQSEPEPEPEPPKPRPDPGDADADERWNMGGGEP